jgi:hypothetical protein
MSVIIGKYEVLSGELLYQALIEGFNAGYNRRLTNMESYESFMKDSYEFFLNLCSRKDKRAVKKRNPSWKTVNYPINVLMWHHHKDGVPCEPHLRIMVGHEIFDVPSHYFKNIPFQAFM